MNFFEILLHPILYIITIIVPLGYGLFVHNIFFKSKKSVFFEIGSLGFLGFSFILLISLFFHFFIPLTDYFCLFILSLGLLLFFFNISIFAIIFTKYYLLALIVLYPLSIIFYPNEDFNHYYLPYLTYIQSSKIVFGLGNLSDALIFSQNSHYDIYVFFKIPFLAEKGFSIPGISFYFFFISFIISQIKKLNPKENIFLLIILILSFSSFTKLRDIGAVIPSQFLMMSSLIAGYICYKFKDKNQYFILSLFYFLFAFILRINAIVILPIITILILINFKNIIELIKQHKLFFSFSVLLTLLFFLKNIIISGCLIYPIQKTCFENNFYWSVSEEKLETKLASYQSFSKGWMFYAREKLNLSDKYIWKNYNVKNFKNVEEYSKSNIFFWSKYWLKDPDYKKILNVYLISLFILIVVSLSNFNKINYNLNLINIHIFKNREFVFLIFAFLNIIMWLNISPQSRYGGYAVSIFFVSLITSHFLKFITSSKEINKLPIIILVIFSICYLEFKNIYRINDDFFKIDQNTYYFPWPNYEETKEGIDYKKITINNLDINFRIKSNKLFNGDISSENKYFLLCGNIPFPCTPIKTKECIKDIEIINSYIFIRNNYKEEKCKKIFQNNMVF
tara:strand:+ start:4249 stop:6111 length:1863 start_codon:yes stop_codon:yes gene_type:complete